MRQYFSRLMFSALRTDIFCFVSFASRDKRESEGDFEKD